MTSRHLNMLRIISPYINRHLQPHVIAVLSFLELRQSLSSIKMPISAALFTEEPLLSNTDELLEKLKSSLPPDAANMIDSFSMVMSMMEMMKMMQETTDEDGSPGQDMIKQLLPKEGADTFELVKMMMENKNGS